MYFDYSKVIDRRLYGFVKPVLRMLSHVLYSTKCKGSENIPKNGKVIIACNHVAATDPAFIVAYSKRHVHFMAKSELFENPVVSLVLRNMNAFPVRRNTSDRRAISYAKTVLDNNWVLGIFPEGKRVRDSSPTDGKTGVAFLSRITGADVVPACIYKVKNGYIRTHVTVKFGEVIKNSELGFENKNRAEELKKATDKIMDNIKQLWEEENCK